ncbi:enoyl-CoA hydratase/isomerase family protein [Oceanobacillus damuensis]|uniref:enoyl-CoA hydratase/isomerase family protein n=1 Tax=Oceanobacillus damuensis TaxID=937928 RepID=UPI00082B1E76|nr:enoyl-CoA hydratase/isomerase family protein [Oceanobacillus damuensis]
MEEYAVYERNEYDYGVIFLNRPQKRNAISKEMRESISICLQRAKQDSIKFLVITGAGEKMFCAGGDLNELHGNLSPEEAYDILNPMKQLVYQILTFPVPTICLLNGDAVGGGCEIASACDIRIAKEGTRYGFVQSNLGILPGWGGGAVLYQKVHPSFALQWLIEAKLYHAEELKEKSWIHRIVKADEWNDSRGLLADYISKSHNQMFLLKQQYLKKITAGNISDLMDEEVKNAASLWDSSEHKAAVEKFLSRK